MSRSPKYTTVAVDLAEVARRREAAERRRRQEEERARRARLQAELVSRRDDLRLRLDRLAGDLDVARPVRPRLEALRGDVKILEIPANPTDEDFARLQGALDALAPQVAQCLEDAEKARTKRLEEEARRAGQISDLLNLIDTRLSAMGPSARKLDGKGRGKVDGMVRDAQLRQAEGKFPAALDAARRASSALAAHEAIIATLAGAWRKRCESLHGSLTTVEDRLRSLAGAADLPEEVQTQARRQLEQLSSDRAELVAAPIDADAVLSELRRRSDVRVKEVDGLLARADDARMAQRLQADVLDAVTRALSARGFLVSPHVDGGGVVLSAVRQGPTQEQVDVRFPAQEAAQLEFVAHGLDPKAIEPACPRTEQELLGVLDELAKQGLPTTELLWESKAPAGSAASSSTPAPAQADKAHHPARTAMPKPQQRQMPGPH